MLSHVGGSFIKYLLLLRIEGENPLATVFLDLYKDNLLLKLNCSILFEIKLHAVLERETWEF